MPAPGKRGHLNRDGAAPFRVRPPGMSDGAVARVLDKLDRALPELETSVDSLIAAFVRQQPDLSDAEITRRIRGLDDPARVARVRGLLAAGHDPDTPGGDTRHLEGPTRSAGPSTPLRAIAAGSRAHVRCGGTLAAAATPTGDIAAAMPRFTVTTATGVSYGGLTYRGAMEQRARTGGTLSVEGT